MSCILTPPEYGGTAKDKPKASARRKLAKAPPMALGQIGNRSIACSLCQRRVFSTLLLVHKQEAHGDAVYHRTATGRPRNIWFGLPAVAQAPAWRRPASLRPVFSR